MFDARPILCSLAQSGRYIAAFSLCLFAMEASAVKESEPQYPGSNAQLPPSTQVSYAQATDQELKTLGAQWALLSAPERRALLAEVRLRWARDRNGSTRVRIQATRQFGVVRQPDGTTIRVERRIIRMFPADKGYGTGFEQRVGNEPGDVEPPSAGGFVPAGPGPLNSPGIRVRASSGQIAPEAPFPEPDAAPANGSNR